MIKSFIPFIVWSIIIFIVSWVVVGINVPPSLFDLVATDKIAHASIYFLLCWLLLDGLYRTNWWNKWMPVFAVLWCVSYGVLMEMLQYYFFPGRYFELFDIVANIIGTLLGLLFFYLYRIRNKNFQSG